MPTFTGTIYKISVLRCVTVPPEIVAKLGGGGRIPVIARYGGEQTVSTIVPAGGNQRRLTLRMEVLRPAKLDAWDKIKIELIPDQSPRHQALPADLSRALQFRPAAAVALERASPSTRRVVIELLEQARTAETRQRRLEAIIERLAENKHGRATKI